jgi:hypothetical protein
MVELSVMCGINARLQIKDCFGNLIVLKAGEKDVTPEEIPRERVIKFTPEDVHIYII